MSKKSASEKTAGLKELFSALTSEEKDLLRFELDGGKAPDKDDDYGDILDTISKLQIEVESLKAVKTVPALAGGNGGENEGGEKAPVKESLMDKILKAIR